MDNPVTIIAALLAVVIVGYLIYRAASRSGSSNSSIGGPRVPPRDPDYR